jgi:hypothetical protein
MPRKYDVYDEHGRKMGEAEEQPSAADQVVGTFILFWMIWEFLKGIGALILLIIELVRERPKQSIAVVVAGVALIYGYTAYRAGEEQRVARRIVLEQQARATKAVEEVRQRVEQATTLIAPPAESTIERSAHSAIEPDKIMSYRTRFAMTVAGSAFQSESSTQWDMVTEYTREPLASHTVVRAGGLAEVIQIGDTVWVVNSGIVVGQESGNPPVNFGEPLVPLDASLLASIAQDKVNTESINGLLADHYVFSKDNAKRLLTVSAAGDLGRWLLAVDQANVFNIDVWASDNGLLIKVVMHIEGTNVNEKEPSLFGIVDCTVETYDFNMPISVRPPD